MKKYKFITIDHRDAKDERGKKPVYRITNNASDDHLGDLFYYSPWKQYIFSPASMTLVFSNSCLRDILDFMENHAGKETKE